MPDTKSRPGLACIERGPTMLLEQVFRMVNFAESKNSEGEFWGKFLVLQRILGLF